MRTVVYIDGFNLYYRALKGTPFKWLNIQTLCESVLPKNIVIHEVNYYTARVSGRINANSPRDQHLYLKALTSLSKVKLHFGSFQTQNKWMFLNQPVQLRPTGQGALNSNPKYACVVKTEEKGSDVNLGVHLVRDALLGKFDHAAVITNDTDLAEPLRIVTQEICLPVTLISPSNRPAATLAKYATNIRHLGNYLSSNQLAQTISLKEGLIVTKPSDW
jgi:hypothetical protein